MITRLRRFWANLTAPENAPGVCPGCGHRNDIWQDTMIEDGYLVARLWRGCPNKRIAFGSLDLVEARRHYAKWTEVSRVPLTDDTPGPITAVKS